MTLEASKSSNVPIDRLLRPFQEFTRLEAASGIVLLFATVFAMAWANSPWASTYAALWQKPLTVGVEGFQLSKSVLLWINDGLMAIFFFVVGLEIKREVLIGELAAVRRAALPIAAAIGGMVVPAGFYLLLNAGQPSVSGWGVPMATDIAFALGVLALLGPRVPLALRIFLTALAIVDDLGAVLVIALFYTAKISGIALGVAAGFVVALVIANRLGARHPLSYGLLGLGVWVALLKSGAHATIAGVLVAMTVPARPRLDWDQFVRDTTGVTQCLARLPDEQGEDDAAETRQSAVHALAGACEQVESPMQRFEHVLHPWVSFVILPMFALANAGVAIGGEFLEGLLQPASLGIVAGLVLGKPIGITLFAWLSVRFGLAALPRGVTWRSLAGAGMLGGIGFTMSLFVADLAFGSSPLLEVAKGGVLIASLLAATGGWLWLRHRAPNEARPPE
jgi:NhaA family Na+:H+ antiporter